MLDEILIYLTSKTQKCFILFIHSFNILRTRSYCYTVGGKLMQLHYINTQISILGAPKHPAILLYVRVDFMGLDKSLYKAVLVILVCCEVSGCMKVLNLQLLQ